VQELEHKARRQDVLVDDELIHAFYDQQLPAEVWGTASLEKWYRDEVKRQPQLLKLTRDELMRHEAAGITTAAFPQDRAPGRHRLRGLTCTSPATPRTA
jgi:ATP-dependent helicase HrpA